MNALFNIEEENKKSFDLVIARARELNPEAYIMNLEMDITATHSNGNPLDFDKLLKFDDFSFQHDMSGIARHICRDSGKLLNHFSPRCSK